MTWAYCANGHRSAAPAGTAGCPVCGGPQYVQCVNGHLVWSGQPRCATCGASVDSQDANRSFSFPLHDPNLSADQQTNINRLLRPGESLLWCGWPDPAVRFTKLDLYLVPFSIVWAVFIVFWEIGASTSAGGGPFFAIFGIPFLAMGAYLTVGRFIVKARRKRRTLYVLTDQRAIVAVGSDQLSETSWRRFPEQVYRHRDKRHVDVTFESGAANGWPRGSMQLANTGLEFFARGQVGIGFYDVADGDRLLAAMGHPF